MHLQVYPDVKEATNCRNMLKYGTTDSHIVTWERLVIAVV